MVTAAPPKGIMIYNRKWKTKRKLGVIQVFGNPGPINYKRLTKVIRSLHGDLGSSQIPRVRKLLYSLAVKLSGTFEVGLSRHAYNPCEL